LGSTVLDYRRLLLIRTLKAVTDLPIPALVENRRRWWVHLVGTPFHSSDLLMGMRANPIYEYRRYSAEFDVTGDDTWAVEVA
jgi:hypothetical protein